MLENGTKSREMCNTAPLKTIFWCDFASPGCSTKNVNLLWSVLTMPNHITWWSNGVSFSLNYCCKISGSVFKHQWWYHFDISRGINISQPKVFLINFILTFVPVNLLYDLIWDKDRTHFNNLSGEVQKYIVWPHYTLSFRYKSIHTICMCSYFHPLFIMRWSSFQISKTYESSLGVKGNPFVLGVRWYHCSFWKPWNKQTFVPLQVSGSTGLLDACLQGMLTWKFRGCLAFR